jgi:Tol biopolymer transport system component
VFARVLSTGELLRPTADQPGGWGTGAEPDVSADGTTIVFRGGVGDQAGLFAYDVATGENELILDAAIDVFDPRASGDGRRVAFTRGDGDHRSVWLLDRDAGTLTRLSAHADGSPVNGAS